MNSYEDSNHDSNAIRTLFHETWVHVQESFPLVASVAFNLDSSPPSLEPSQYAQFASELRRLNAYISEKSGPMFFRAFTASYVSSHLKTRITRDGLYGTSKSMSLCKRYMYAALAEIIPTFNTLRLLSLIATVHQAGESLLSTEDQPDCLSHVLGPLLPFGSDFKTLCKTVGIEGAESPEACIRILLNRDDPLGRRPTELDRAKEQAVLCIKPYLCGLIEAYLSASFDFPLAPYMDKERPSFLYLLNVDDLFVESLSRDLQSTFLDSPSLCNCISRYYSLVLSDPSVLCPYNVTACLFFVRLSHIRSPYISSKLGIESYVRMTGSFDGPLTERDRSQVISFCTFFSQGLAMLHSFAGSAQFKTIPDSDKYRFASRIAAFAKCMEDANNMIDCMICKRLISPSVLASIVCSNDSYLGAQLLISMIHILALSNNTHKELKQFGKAVFANTTTFFSLSTYFLLLGELSASDVMSYSLPLIIDCICRDNAYLACPNADWEFSKYAAGNLLSLCVSLSPSSLPLLKRKLIECSRLVPLLHTLRANIDEHLQLSPQQQEAKVKSKEMDYPQTLRASYFLLASLSSLPADVARLNSVSFDSLVAANAMFLSYTIRDVSVKGAGLFYSLLLPSSVHIVFLIRCYTREFSALSPEDCVIMAEIFGENLNYLTKLLNRDATFLASKPLLLSLITDLAVAARTICLPLHTLYMRGRTLTPSQRRLLASRLPFVQSPPSAAVQRAIQQDLRAFVKTKASELLSVADNVIKRVRQLQAQGDAVLE